MWSQHWIFTPKTTASSNNVIKVTGQVKLTVTDQPRGAPACAATTVANGMTTMTAAVTPSSLGQPATAEVLEQPVTIFATEVAEKPNKSSLKRMSREKVPDVEEYNHKEDQFTCLGCVTDALARIWSSWFD